MAKYQAIAATEIAVRLLLENAALDSESSDVELFQADKLQNPSSATKRTCFRPPCKRRELLAKQPRMHVMAIRSEGRDTSRYELRLFERKLDKISPASPLDAVSQVGVGPA